MGYDQQYSYHSRTFVYWRRISETDNDIAQMALRQNQTIHQPPLAHASSARRYQDEIIPLHQDTAGDNPFQLSCHGNVQSLPVSHLFSLLGFASIPKMFPHRS